MQAASQFHAHPDNARRHPLKQREAVESSLRKFGMIAPIIVNERTGNVIDGHERVWQGLQNDDAELPYITVDIDPADEATALLTFDRTGDLADWDADVIARLLPDVRTDLDPALDRLMAELAEEVGVTPNLDPLDPPEPVDRSVTCPDCGSVFDA